MSDDRRTRIVTTYLDDGFTDTTEIGPGEFAVICGPDRYVYSETAYHDGPTVVVIKPGPR